MISTSAKLMLPIINYSIGLTILRNIFSFLTKTYNMWEGIAYLNCAPLRWDPGQFKCSSDGTFAQSG